MPDQLTVTVQADYSQFVLADSEDVDLVVDAPKDDALVRFDEGSLYVTTGVQSGPVEVHAETLAFPPDVAGTEWDDVVELSLTCRHALVVAELMGEARATVTTLPGTYRLRVSARGRDAGQARGDAGARAALVEHYMVEVWPTPKLDPGVTLRSSSLQPVEPPPQQYLEPARAAAWRIAADIEQLAGARALSGDTATVTAEWLYRATRRKLFINFADLSRWTSGMCTRSAAKPSLGFYYVIGNDPQARAKWIFDGLPTTADGTLIGVITALDPPGSVTTDVTWFRDSRWEVGGRGFLPRPTTMTTTLTQTKDAEGRAQTLVRMTHERVPVEWADDLATAWMCKLEAGAKVWRLEE